MTATMTPRQPALLRNLAVSPPPPDQLATFVVSGVLASDARTYVQPDGRALLQVLVQQRLQYHPKACPVLATYVMPAGCNTAAQLAARHKAAALRAGTLVCATGRALAPGWHQGNTVLVLTDVQSIETPPFAPTRRSPRQQEEAS
jgi:hypothetical protein